MKIFGAIILGWLSVSAAVAQDACEVKVIALVGEYEGDCKRGIAHGEGMAKGEDIYEGKWKRGYPHGIGTYSWANGDVYEGNWRRGQRHGEGTMTYAGGKVEKGFWKKDSYLGEYEQPYRVTSPPGNVKYTLLNRGDETNRVSVQIMRNGQLMEHEKILIIADKGTQFENLYEFGWESVEYPISLQIEYQIDNLMNTAKIKLQFAATIYEPGDWLIQLKN